MSNKNDLEIIDEQVVVLKQPAILDFSSIDRVKKSIEQRINDLDIENIEATDENKKKLVAIRIDLNKEMNAMEKDRKTIKKAVNEPYKEFNAEYKPLKELYDTNIDLVKTRIDTIDRVILNEKFDKAMAYFTEKKAHYVELLQEQTVGIEFYDFEMLELHIILSTTDSKLRKEIDTKLEKVYNDLLVINGNEHMARVYNLYKKNLDLAKSLVQVQNDIKQEQELLAKKQEQDSKVVEPEKEKEPSVKANVVEEIVSVSFTINDTKENIIKVREFMNENGISYE